MVWDGLIACYLFLAGLGAGAFALAALAGFVKPDAVKLRTVGYLVAPIAVGVGTLLLVVDAKAGLMNPLRFFSLVTNLSSIMAWGVIILVAFLAVSAAALVVMLLKKGTPKWLDAVGLVCAVAVAVYTGMLLGDAMGFPLWNPVVLPLLFLVSAASSGFAAVLLIGRAMKLDGIEELGFLKKTGLAFPVIEAVLVAVLLAVTAGVGGSGATAAGASVANLVSGPYAVAFWLGLVIVGLVLPFSIEVLQMRKGRAAAAPVAAAAGAGTGATVTVAEGEGGAAAPAGLALVGEAGVLIGGFLLRFLIIMAAVPIALV